MANVKIPSETSAPRKPWDHKAQADNYLPEGTGHGGEHVGQVDSYAPRPKLGAGGPHNRGASGHESETR